MTRQLSDATLIAYLDGQRPDADPEPWKRADKAAAAKRARAGRPLAHQRRTALLAAAAPGGLLAAVKPSHVEVLAWMAERADAPTLTMIVQDRAENWAGQDPESVLAAAKAAVRDWPESYWWGSQADLARALGRTPGAVSKVVQALTGREVEGDRYEARLNAEGQPWAPLQLLVPLSRDADGALVRWEDPACPPPPRAVIGYAVKKASLRTSVFVPAPGKDATAAERSAWRALSTPRTVLRVALVRDGAVREQVNAARHADRFRPVCGTGERFPQTPSTERENRALKVQEPLVRPDPVSAPVIEQAPAPVCRASGVAPALGATRDRGPQGPVFDPASTDGPFGPSSNVVASSDVRPPTTGDGEKPFTGGAAGPVPAVLTARTARTTAQKRLKKGESKVWATMQPPSCALDAVAQVALLIVNEGLSAAGVSRFGHGGARWSLFGGGTGLSDGPLSAYMTVMARQFLARGVDALALADAVERAVAAHVRAHELRPGIPPVTAAQVEQALADVARTGIDQGAWTVRCVTEYLDLYALDRDLAAGL